MNSPKKLYRPNPDDEEQVRTALREVDNGNVIALTDEQSDAFVAWLDAGGEGPCPYGG